MYDKLTSNAVGLVLTSRLNQVRDRGLQRIERSKDIDVHDRFKGIGGELVDCRQKISSSTGTCIYKLASFVQEMKINNRINIAYITKSIPPSSLTHRSTESFKLLKLRTSTAPIPMTFAPGRTVAMSFAALSVFSTLRPMIQAFAPRWTIARTWALHIVPAPPVQKTTLLAGGEVRGQQLKTRKARGMHTEDAVPPHIAHILILWQRHLEYEIKLDWNLLAFRPRLQSNQREGKGLMGLLVTDSR